MLFPKKGLLFSWTYIQTWKFRGNNSWFFKKRLFKGNRWCYESSIPQFQILLTGLVVDEPWTRMGGGGAVVVTFCFKVGVWICAWSWKCLNFLHCLPLVEFTQSQGRRLPLISHWIANCISMLLNLFWLQPSAMPVCAWLTVSVLLHWISLCWLVWSSVYSGLCFPSECSRCPAWV